jgi:periplasmic protein TonB
MAACVVLSLLLAIGAIRFWPMDQGFPDTLVFDTRGQELIQVEEVLPTQQKRRRPPPPAPLTPVIVPDETVLDEIEIELTENLITADLGEDEGEEEGEDAPTTGGVTRADSGPRAFRVVEPEYTREARRRKIRAEVIVEVLVNARGRVETARVINRYLLDGRDNQDREAVDILGYGLEESALSAAEQWMFRPAREGGKVVSSRTTLTFSFGV